MDVMGSGYLGWAHHIMLYDSNKEGTAEIESSEIISHSTSVEVTRQNNEDTLRQADLLHATIYS